MSGITALEIGAKTCAIVRMSGRRHGSRISAAEGLDQATFPDSDAFANALRQVRKKLKLSRRARAVVWGLPEGATGNDPAVAPLIAPLLDAGFRVERVVTPCDALAVLARLRTPRPNAATCWLAIDRDGVAVIGVRPGKLLYSHSFVWDSAVGAIGSQARLLQRYSLVSVLAPEVQRAMAAAREEGTPIEGIVTCGNLPDLRSLTMPLIEELDLEVETLDSLEGLAVERNVADDIGDAAAALRIACAAAVARGSRPSWPDRRSLTLRRYGALAAGLAVMFVVGWYVIARLLQPSEQPHVASTQRAAPPATHARAIPPTGPSKAPSIAAPGSPTSVPPPARSTVTSAPKTAHGSATTPSGPPALQSAPSAPRPMRPAAPTAQSSEGRGARPAPPLAPPRLRAAPTPPAKRLTGPRPAPGPAPLPPLRGAQPAETSRVSSEPAPAPSPRRARPQPLKDPLPRVTGILVSQDRRYATIETGQVVTVGDVIGARTVVAIDERSVTLREPSGLEVRVELRGPTKVPDTSAGSRELRIPADRP